MIEQSYPRIVSVYKGEGRILVIPVIDHIGGFSAASDWFKTTIDMENYSKTGGVIFDALKMIEESPLSTSNSKERTQNLISKQRSKYKGYLSFWKNNHCSFIKLKKTGEFEIYSAKKDFQNKRGYYGCIKEIRLPHTATAEEIGKAVMDVFQAAENFYEKHD